MSTVIDEILDPVADCLTPDVAKRLTELRLNPTTQARIDELAGQANEGLLTPAERAYLEKKACAESMMPGNPRRPVTGRSQTRCFGTLTGCMSKPS